MMKSSYMFTPAIFHHKLYNGQCTRKRNELDKRTDLGMFFWCVLSEGRVGVRITTPTLPISNVPSSFSLLFAPNPKTM